MKSDGSYVKEGKMASLKCIEGEAMDYSMDHLEMSRDYWAPGTQGRQINEK